MTDQPSRKRRTPPTRVRAPRTIKAIGLALIAATGLALMSAVAESQVPKSKEEAEELLAQVPEWPFAKGAFTKTIRCRYSVPKREITITGMSLRRRARITLAMQAQQSERSFKAVTAVAKTKLPALGPGPVTLRLRMTQRGASYLRYGRSAHGVLIVFVRNYGNFRVADRGCPLRPK